MPSSKALLLREAILDGLDEHLVQSGFRRRKRFQDWVRSPQPDIAQGLHLNFGRTAGQSALYIVPTVMAGIHALEVELAAYQKREPAKDAFQFSYQLAHLLGSEYIAYTDEGPDPLVRRLAADFQRHGLPKLERLTSLESVAALMLSPDGKEWPVTWASMRARLLPLVLALLGRMKEAHDWLERLRNEIAGHDQLRPDIDHFTIWYEARFGQAA
jgi:hypothetical protein